MENILLSIITPTYNSEKYIKRFFDSFPVEFSNLMQFIIVDNLSIDQTTYIVQNYKSKFNIVLLQESDMGIYDAMNKGINLSAGEYLYFLNSDDWIETSSFFQLIKILDLSKYDIISFDQKRWLSLTSYVIDKPFLSNVIHHPLPHQCFVFSKKVVNYIGLYDTKFEICSDYDFLIKVYFSNLCYIKLPEVIANFSTTGISSKKENLFTYFQEIIFIWEKFGLSSRGKRILFLFKTIFLYIKKTLFIF